MYFHKKDSVFFENYHSFRGLYVSLMCQRSYIYPCDNLIGFQTNPKDPELCLLHKTVLAWLSLRFGCYQAHSQLYNGSV